MAFGETERGYQPDPWEYFDSYKTSGEGQSATRPNMDSFTHVTERTKERDKLLLAKKQSKPDLHEQKESGADAFAFENFLTAQAMKQGWFEGEVIPTTEYDDWVSGADAVVEWPVEGGEPLRLAVDFTAAHREHVFFKKADKLEGDVVAKYLRSVVEDGKEMRCRMPVVILGFDKTVFRHVATSGETIGPDHPMKRLLLEQAHNQINMQIQFSLLRILQAPRARRSQLGDEMKARILDLTDDTSTEELLAVYQDLDPKELELVAAPKYRARIQRLLLLKQKLETLSHDAAESIPLEGTWAELERTSKTHNILSK